MNQFLLILMLLFSLSSPALARVRKVETTQDQIVTVKTAIGIATIIQVPDRPNSIVVGDQAAFKVEYLDEAITIKPLRAGAKSNLYVYTDFRRFNVQLVTGAEPSADYVVYLENPKEKKQTGSLHWISVHRSITNEGVKFAITRAARTSDGVLIVEFTLTSDKRQKVEPAWIWLTQEGTTKPIQNLYLSNLECSPGAPVSGSFQILRSDINENTPLRFELRRKKTSTVTISKVATWK